MIEVGINYWALVAAAVANMAIGILWYGPLFGKEWKKLSGLVDETIRNMPLKPWQAMVGGFINSLVIVYVLFFFTAIETSLSGALTIVFWIWLGFVATTQIGGFLWAGKPLKLFFIDTIYLLVSYGVMASILVLWQ